MNDDRDPTDPLSRLPDPSTRRHLELIRELEGEIVPSVELQARVPGFKAYKGIYKPSGSPYALWIRQTARGVYPDRDPVMHPDGSWTYRYAPESQEGRFDASLPTFKGLVRCREDHVPVGVFRQVDDQAGRRTYKVLGLGFVESFDGTHFVIRGEPLTETSLPLPEGVIPPFAPFDPSPLPIQSVMRRLRERRFDSVIRELYHGKCSLCSVGYRLKGRVLALEAAHIIPLSVNGISGDVRNGLLLCSNHHTLFDAFAWAFDKDYEVVVTADREFRQTALANHLLAWEGKRLPNLPSSVENYPAPEAAAWRLQEFGRHQ